MTPDRAAAERVAEPIAMSIYEAAALEAGFPLDQRIYDDAVNAITTALLTWGAQRWRAGVEAERAQCITDVCEECEFGWPRNTVNGIMVHEVPAELIEKHGFPEQAECAAEWIYRRVERALLPPPEKGTP